jgi:hypothetical protein
MPPEERVIVPLPVYQQLVDRCARERLNLAIANGSAFHARILISKLFEIAKEKVEIVSGRLTDVNPKGIDVYGFESVIAAARKFLTAPSTVLTIIVQHGSVHRGNENRFLKQVVDDPNRNGTVHLCIPKIGLLDESVPHFMVSDRGAYRVETGKDAKPSEEAIKAIANFGDAKTGEELAKLFADLQSYLADNDSSSVIHTYKPGHALSPEII